MKKPSLSKAQKRYVGLFLGAVVVIALGYWGYGAYQAKTLASNAWPAVDGGVYASAVTRGGVTSLVPGNELYNSGVTDSGIPALTNPKYVSVLAADSVTADTLPGIDVDINGEHRFYPVQIMNWHEVVNDTINGQDIAVTYCPLCGSGIVYDRHLGGQTLSLSASGKVYNNNTVLKDGATDSLWLQATGEAIQGSLIGQSLTVIPSSMIAWKDWKAMYPSGLVLSTNTGVTRDYTRHPYGNYDTSKGLYFPINHTDPNFTPKSIVYGVTDGTNGIGLWTTIVEGVGMVDAKLGDTPIIAVYDFESRTVHVFETKSQDGTVHTFSYNYVKKQLKDKETGRLWDARTGIDMASSSSTSRLIELPATRGYWFCLSAMHPTWVANLGSSTAVTQEEVKK